MPRTSIASGCVGWVASGTGPPGEGGLEGRGVYARLPRLGRAASSTCEISIEHAGAASPTLIRGARRICLATFRRSLGGRFPPYDSSGGQLAEPRWWPVREGHGAVSNASPNVRVKIVRQNP